MNFSDLIQNRYSVRAYKPDSIEKEKLDQILQAAILAPTAANRQPFRIFVIETEKNKEQLQELYGREWFVQPPLVVGIAAVADEAWIRRDDDKNYAEVDATIAMDHLIMQAADLGIGTCWIAAFNPSVAKLMLDLPNDWEPIAFTPLGYPADNLRPKKRKDIDELVVFLDD
jgi:nitroreductase